MRSIPGTITDRTVDKILYGPNGGLDIVGIPIVLDDKVEVGRFEFYEKSADGEKYWPGYSGFPLAPADEGPIIRRFPTDVGASLQLDSYQEQTRELDIYPRVFTEDQVLTIAHYVAIKLGAESEALTTRLAEEAMDMYETPFNRLVLHVLGLASEAGELAGKIKKIGRDQWGDMGEDEVVDLGKETGDVQWYVANIASDLGERLGKIARENLNKLNSRKARGVLGGSGDNR